MLLGRGRGLIKTLMKIDEYKLLFCMYIYTGAGWN